MPLFDSESARLNSAKAVAQRRLNSVNRKKLIQQLLDRPLTEADSKAQPVINPPIDPINDYQSNRVKRVREQVEVVSKRLDDALEADKLDAGAIDRLANALTRIQEIERVMSGRPLPGSKRPATEKPAKRASTFEPVE